MLQAGVVTVAVHMDTAVRNLDQPERIGGADIVLVSAEVAFYPWVVGGHSIEFRQLPVAKKRGVTGVDLAAGVALRQQHIATGGEVDRLGQLAIGIGFELRCLQAGLPADGGAVD